MVRGTMVEDVIQTAGHETKPESLYKLTHKQLEARDID